jgi:hypothetical protein
MNDLDETIDQYFLATKTIRSVVGLGPIENRTNHYWTIVEVPSLDSNRRICIYSTRLLQSVIGKDEPTYSDDQVFKINRDGEEYVVVGVSTYQDVLLVFRKDHECIDEKVKESYLEWCER